jgi:uncharacterized damage-inducible protein DinB
MLPPIFPAGSFQVDASFDAQSRLAVIQEIEAFPSALLQTLSRVPQIHLDTRYQNWTIRQIVHHLADSHVHCYIRFKWTLTEDTPTIKAYHEGDWAALEDSRTGDVHVPLTVLEGIHARWVQLLRTVSDEQFARSYFHPEKGKTVTLNAALQSYAWHGRHHMGQIQWLIEQHGW